MRTTTSTIRTRRGGGGFRLVPHLLSSFLVLLYVSLVLAAADFYKVLGVSKTASDKEIKKAYRKLSKQYHPDKNQDESAKVKFLEIGHAYEALSDPEKRKTYDRFGEEGLKQQAGPGGAGAFHDPFDIFRQAFGGQQFQRERKGNNMLAEIEVDLKDIYSGGRITFNIARKQICEECEGSGAKSAKDIVPCTTCEGRGVRLVRHQLAPGIYQQIQMHCELQEACKALKDGVDSLNSGPPPPSQSKGDVCNGRGKKTLHGCPTCRGNRIVDSTVELNLDIDRGMPEGTEVTFEGEADEQPGIAPGDVIVRVKSRQKPGGFVRKGSNLYWGETLSVAEALLGFRKTVKGLDGHNIVLQRDEVTQPGFVQVIHGEGLPIYHESGHGDLYVEYKVVLPSNLSTKMRKGLESALIYKSPGHTEL